MRSKTKIKICLGFTLSLILFFLNTYQAHAEKTINRQVINPAISVSSSAKTSKTLPSYISYANTDTRIEKMEKYLTWKSSPLAPYAAFLVKKADQYQIPWSMVAAISGIESNFCHRIPSDSHNCWGWNNGKTYFSNYDDAINTISRSIRTNYFNWGLTTPQMMSSKYAPPAADKWARNVRFFMNQIEYFSYPKPTTLPLSI